ncbi:hypothetical protein B0T25DRAFT_249397 [Lasiosphaeria hispida]|uniref:Cell wall mannoprotein PIR1-like C-terminal domain-containing protein n=1 Tax=Lasiosphaeria hispida TaxID=260671 RepID=A0AAJ0HFN2_9PEZI|nr:hypothetical protein B0T25DRAFT_249397 [Lasiosphaeria hispida]
MRTQVLALLAAVGSAAAQAVTEKVAPTASAPAGCEPSVEGKFEISIVELGDKSKRDQFLKKRGPTCSGNGILVAELKNGVVTDSQGRTGYVASNFQFQFDGPPQAGAIYTAGFSHCGNGSLAFGGSTVFYQCKSGDFSNLYDRWWAEQCSPVEILVMPCGEGAKDETTGDRVVGTTVVPTTVVIPLSDGQPQVITTSKAIPLCQIGDGQVQGHTTPCAAITPAPTPTNVPVGQYSDGQIQVTNVPAPSGTGPAVSHSVPTPLASGVPNGTTLRTSPASAPSVVPTGAPPTTGGAGRPNVDIRSVAALAVGLMGGVWVL